MPTVKQIAKAVKIADHLINAHTKNAKGMEELAKNWGSINKELALEIASVHRDVAICIGMIKELLTKPKEKKLVKVHT